MMLYSKKDSCMVIGGIVLYHVLVACLVVFWIYRFLIIDFDPGVFILLGIFIFGTALTDIMICRIQGFSRFLIRCQVDKNGIYCSGIGLGKWTILWKNIHVFGTIGNESPGESVLIFLSTDSDEKYSKEKCASISKNRIVFQSTGTIWKSISEHLPGDIKTKIDNALNGKYDCFYRVWKTGNGVVS